MSLTIGALVFLLIAHGIRAFRCPRIVSLTKSRKELEDHGGIAALKNALREELQNHVDEIGIRNARLTIRHIVRVPHVEVEIPIPENADTNELLVAIDRAQFKDLGQVMESAKSLFDFLRPISRYVVLGILVVSWVLMGIAIVIAIITIFR